MNKIKINFFLIFLIFIFTHCGGGSTPMPPVPPEINNVKLGPVSSGTAEALGKTAVATKDLSNDIVSLRSHLNGVGKTGGLEPERMALVDGAGLGIPSNKAAEDPPSQTPTLKTSLNDLNKDSPFGSKNGSGGEGGGGGGSSGNGSGLTPGKTDADLLNGRKKEDLAKSPAEAGSLYSGGGGGVAGGGSDPNSVVGGLSGVNDDSQNYAASRDLAASGIEDPSDYFSRIGVDENLFKRVERRYTKKNLAWLLQDTREIVPKHTK